MRIHFETSPNFCEQCKYGTAYDICQTLGEKCDCAFVRDLRNGGLFFIIIVIIIVRVDKCVVEKNREIED